MKKYNNAFRTDNMCQFGDSSNDAHDGANGHEDVPEMLQRVCKEEKTRRDEMENIDRVKIDPALATGPFITTINDIIGLFLYMLLGRLLYGMFAL